MGLEDEEDEDGLYQLPIHSWQIAYCNLRESGHELPPFEVLMKELQSNSFAT